MRTALYARYSTDKQRETSIDDQLRAARERAAREGWEVVQVYQDEGVSGSTPVALRPGGKALLAGALAGRWDVLIVEGLDRLSRELGEAEQLVKRLEHRGIRIVGTADGYDSEARGRKVMRIARGLVNELYLDDLREKTHRGLAGQFDRGLSAGGRTYGYTTVEAPGGRRMIIEPHQAEVVREIYRRYADGDSLREIVHNLNSRGEPSPRGGTWAISALASAHARGLGMLSNEAYIGRVVWNRRQWLKDPDSGKRRYVERPASEWQVREAPELRIIDDTTWRAVRARIENRQHAASPDGRRRGRPPRTLFGGLLRCPTCDGPVVAVSAWGYGCGNRKDRGPAVCTNASVVPRQALDRRLLAVVRDELLSPQTMASVEAVARQAVRDLTADSRQTERQAKARAAELAREIDNLVNALAAVGTSPAIVARLQAAEAERAKLDAAMTHAQADEPEAVVADVIREYRAALLDLQRELEAEEDRDRTRRLLADLLGPVVVGRDAEGPYADLIEPAERLLVAAAGGSSLNLVAGARNAGYRRVRFG